jgi:hypothetical protein
MSVSMRGPSTAVERAMGVKGSGAWTAELGEAFLALLRETGNARASARTLGYPWLFNDRMKSDPAFRRACAAAAAEADARLSRAASPFPRPVEYKGELPDDPDSLGDYLQPGRKQGQPEPVIRRTSTGRMQITLTHEGEWTSEIEAAFLARLRATGNFEASARAVGFQPNSVFARVRKWTAFARDCEEALEQANVKLDYKLVAQAHALLRRPGEPLEEGEEEREDVPFDPEAAMRILGFIDRRRRGRTTRGGRKGPPERPFAEAVKSILAKIEAIERHEAMIKERGEGQQEDPHPNLLPQAGEGAS